MDYQQELNRLEKNEKEQNNSYWKPEAGQWKVLALSEIQDSNPFTEEGKEPQPRKQIALLVNDNKVLWTFPQGQTSMSVYGQLCKLGILHKKLENVSFTVVVTGTGKTKRFTIVL